MSRRPVRFQPLGKTSASPSLTIVSTEDKLFSNPREHLHCFYILLHGNSLPLQHPSHPKVKYFFINHLPDYYCLCESVSLFMNQDSKQSRLSLKMKGRCFLPTTIPYETYRKYMLGAKLLIMRPPATIKPLKIATGLAPNDDTHILQTGPREKKTGKTFLVNTSTKKTSKKVSICENHSYDNYLNVSLH